MSVLTRFFVYSACIIFVLGVNACSFSYSSKSSSNSSKSSSDSSSSPFKWSSASSDGDAKYQADVSDYTYAYLKSSATTDYAGFQKGLSKIAADHGVSDWQSDPKTYKAIGKGLKKAHIEGVSYETYKKNFADSDPTRMEEIDEGYRSED